MSKGPGSVEARVAELFAATRDRALTIGDLADNAYGLNGQPATRAQRLSATRAAHRLIRRIREASERASKFYAVAHLDAEAAVGERPTGPDFLKRANYDAWEAALEAYKVARAPYDAAFKASKSYQRAESLRAYADQFGSRMRFIDMGDGRQRGEREFWRATADKRGTLYFHPPDVPVRVWAVKIDRSGVHWFDAEVTKVTASKVMARYAGEIARLDREKLWHWWAWWRAVCFVSSRAPAASPPSSKQPGMSVTGVRLAPFRRQCACRSTKRDGCSGCPSTTPATTSSPRSGGRRRRRIRIVAGRRRCSRSCSRRATGCWRRWGRARRRRSRPPTPRVA
jgi:hypothetical protein